MNEINKIFVSIGGIWGRLLTILQKEEDAADREGSE
jgi:hypothetical protein